MRKNPYNKNIKDRFPLFMQGPSTTTALTKNEAQKVVLKKTMSQKRKYEANGVSFIMIQPPLVNLRTMTSNLQDILNIEMGQTEVTQGLFEALMGWNNSRSKGLQNPVEYITWFDCIAFCNKLSNLLGFKPYYKMEDVYKIQRTGSNTDSIGTARVTAYGTGYGGSNGFRLPTEDEWESFAKAGTQNKWSGTDVESELENYAWYRKNSEGKTHPVGEKLPNEWGLYDMSGNVMECCWDRYYYPEYYEGGEDDEDDEDDDTSLPRVLRGGSYRSHTDFCRVGSPNGFDANHLDTTVGFRICRTIK